MLKDGSPRTRKRAWPRGFLRRCLRTLTEHASYVNSVAFSPDRKPIRKSALRKRRKSAAKKRRKSPTRLARADHLSLVGVLKDGPYSIAMIRNRKTGRSEKVRLDDLIDGWEVASIDPMKVEMVQGNRLVILELYQR